ncbi:MAG: type II toxin-antitoxin system Phd/YefM family antitoxin [Spirochaetaceae bacterium]|nr:type II toxin-antitoxin system Phd/YefM family antitoxin [Spirochaetaceae bacterium]
MTTVNALKIRNQFGEVLKILEETGEPVLVSKGRELRAVLISVEDFKIRFLDKQVEEEANRVFQEILSDRSSRITDKDPDAILRKIRGYED